jgi:hypothetical protein
MTDTTFETLRRVNVSISIAEDAGDAQGLDGLLAPKLAFRRANGEVVDREEFLAGVKRSGPRQTTLRAIVMLGRDRALVTCDVSLPVDGEQTTFENARLFIRTGGDEWKLLGWANEPHGP